jgi:photosystem II stability/assembly factor-like uncharacterized protein
MVANSTIMKKIILIIAILCSRFGYAQNFTWTQQNSTVAHTLNDVFFTDNLHGWVVGINGTILKTTDGGATWMLQNSGTAEPLLTVFFANSNLGWAAGGASNALLLKTVNGGLTWTATPTNINSGPILDLAFAAGSPTGFAITTDSIYASLNNGTNWTSEPYTGVIGTAVNKAIAVVSASQAFVGGRRFQTGIQDSSPEVYDRKSIGGSYAWGPTASNQFANMDRLESIAFANATTGFAGGIQGKVYRMHAILPVVTGPWNVCLDLGGGNNQTINSISFINDSTGILCTPKQVGMTKYSLIYHTQNSGDSWTNPDTITDFLISQLHYVDAVSAWAVGANGKIYKATNTLFTTDEFGDPKNLHIFPNPSADYLYISSQNLNTDEMEISVYSSLGQFIPVQSHICHTKNVVLNVQHFTPGVFFIRVKTEKGICLVKRFVKL